MAARVEGINPADLTRQINAIQMNLLDLAKTTTEALGAARHLDLQALQPSINRLDTSVFIARESGHAIAELPQRVALSVITIGELQLGVLNSGDSATRSRRASTLALARGRSHSGE